MTKINGIVMMENIVETTVVNAPNTSSFAYFVNNMDDNVNAGIVDWTNNILNNRLLKSNCKSKNNRTVTIGNTNNFNG